MKNSRIAQTKAWKRLQDTKISVWMTAVIMFCCTLCGCASKMKDGQYTARFRYPENGYVDYLTVTFQNGKASGVELDGYREDEQQTKRSEVDSQSSYSKWKSSLEKSIQSAGAQADKIKGNVGSGKYVAKVKQLYRAILEQAAVGNTGEIIVENEKQMPDMITESPSESTEVIQSDTLNKNSDQTTDSKQQNSGSGEPTTGESVTEQETADGEEPNVPDNTAESGTDLSSSKAEND